MEKLVKNDSQSYQSEKVHFEVELDPGFDQLIHGPVEAQDTTIQEIDEDEQHVDEPGSPEE